MVPSTHDGRHLDGGRLTIIVSPTTVDPQRCVDALAASGLSSTVDTFDPGGGDSLVQATVPCTWRPTSDVVEAATQLVVRALDQSGIEHEVRGTGFDAGATG